LKVAIDIGKEVRNPRRKTQVGTSTNLPAEDPDILEGEMFIAGV
jgi:hypothetical protein